MFFSNRGVDSGQCFRKHGTLHSNPSITNNVAEFFLPMRALDSLFHVAMNGISASTKIFDLLDLPEEEEKTEELAKSELGVKFENVRFGYKAEREILLGISLDISSGKFVSIAGVSGCGKSTISQLISGVNRTKVGNIVIGGKNDQQF